MSNMNKNKKTRFHCFTEQHPQCLYNTKPLCFLGRKCRFRRLIHSHYNASPSWHNRQNCGSYQIGAWIIATQIILQSWIWIFDHIQRIKWNKMCESLILTLDMTFRVLGDHACTILLICWPLVYVQSRVWGSSIQDDPVLQKEKGDIKRDRDCACWGGVYRDRSAWLKENRADSFEKRSSLDDIKQHVVSSQPGRTVNPVGK